MSERKFDLGDYVEVKDRIRIFYELFGQGRLVTDEVTVLTAPDNKQRVMVKALAYRTVDDPHPGVGYSWMELPGTTSYTRGSELENTETSAWGRAIASLGILIDASIASSQEVSNKQRDDDSTAPAPVKPNENEAYREDEELVGEYEGTGMVRNGGSAGYKLEARQGPDGHVIGFRMEFAGDKAIPQVIVEGGAGETLFVASGMNPGALRDTRLHVKGRLFNVRSNRRSSWKRLRVSAWENAEAKYPAEDAGPEPPANVELFGESDAA